MTTNTGLNVENVILDHILEVLQTVFTKLDISIARYQNDILCILLLYFYLLLFIIHLNIVLVFACALC